MPQNGNVLELRNNGDFHNNCYFALSSDLNLNYYYLQCNGSSSDTHFSDVIVPIVELNNLLINNDI